jgi:hypothetical protein
MADKSPVDLLIIEARVAAGAAWGGKDGSPHDEKTARDILRRCATTLEAVLRESNGYAETLDNIRDALGQKATHHLVMADDVRELVEAAEACGRDRSCKAAAALKSLRKRYDP